jgi:hypothetical protein
MSPPAQLLFLGGYLHSGKGCQMGTMDAWCGRGGIRLRHVIR